LTTSDLERDGLGPEEWDFTKKRVPKSEIVACFIYEYGRGLVDRPRPRSKRDRKSDGFKAKVDFRQVMIDYLPRFRRIAGPRFPDTAWQTLDKGTQSKLVETVEQGVLNPGISPRNYAISVYDLPQDHRINSEALTRCDGPLKDETPKTRRWTRLADIPPERGGARDLLRWLGALRVKERYGNDLVEHTRWKKVLKVNAPYSSSSDLYEHAREAADVLAVLVASVR
jgi:hypothetical protein